MLTLTVNIVGGRKEYFEDLLSPADSPSVEKADAGVSGMGLSIILVAKIIKVVKELLGSKMGRMKSTPSI